VLQRRAQGRVAPCTTQLLLVIGLPSRGYLAEAVKVELLALLCLQVVDDKIEVPRA